MNWQFSVSLRYLTSKHREKFISIISLISVLGVAVGVAALIIVLAVMSGFDNELKEKLIGTNSHIIIESEFGVKRSQDLMSAVSDTRHVVGAAYFIHGQALVRHSENVSGVILKGIIPSEEVKVNKLGGYMRSGSLDFGKNGIVIGSELASKLGAGLGDSVTVVSPAYIEGKDFTVSGIFTSGMYEYDSTLVYVDIPHAQELFGVKDLVSGLAVRVDDAFSVSSVKMQLKEKLAPPLTVKTWTEMNRTLLAALKLEKTVMFVILTLIVIVACFNIASALIMTVLEKTKDVGILKSIGSNSHDIMAVFAMQGCMIGVLGTVFGAVFGLGVSWLLKTYQFIDLPRDIYYIDKLPVNVEPKDVVLIVLCSFIISALATLYPAYRASKLDPVEALRYE